MQAVIANVAPSRGKLTTHVLDTFHGRPAAGLAIELSRIGETPQRLASVRTGADGRAPHPLLEGAAMLAGEYELAFHLADYFRAQGVALADPPFLGVVVVRVGLADALAHYHVPLIASPWSYSTYRGS